MGDEIGELLVSMRHHADGTMSIVVEHAPDMIGVSMELLAKADPQVLRVTSEGHLSVASDGLTLYRPVRFDPRHGTHVLVCQRIYPDGPKRR